MHSPLESTKYDTEHVSEFRCRALHIGLKCLLTQRAITSLDYALGAAAQHFLGDVSMMLDDHQYDLVAVVL